MRKRRSRKDGLEEVLQTAGSLSAVADVLGITVQSVSQWGRIPEGHCQEIERAFGISREIQRPDINWSYRDKIRRRSGNGHQSAAA